MNEEMLGRSTLLDGVYFLFLAMKYIPVIGMEVHVELKTKSKMFCSCQTGRDLKEPNTHICPVHRGSLGRCRYRIALRSNQCSEQGIALGCSLRLESKFDRKNYFTRPSEGVPDIVNMISHCEAGALAIDGKTFRITRIHLNTKTVSRGGRRTTLVDFNRARAYRWSL